MLVRAQVPVEAVAKAELMGGPAGAPRLAAKESAVSTPAKVN